MEIPHYLTVQDAQSLLAQMNVHVNIRQLKRTAEMDGAGKRKLPWFVDPIEGRLMIEKSALLSAYFNRQHEAERG
ncbi:MAG: hypothetical protein ABS75_33225 [Pelagibacterium sp. SCN 63-23]|nr:MAG: hypothetical protein ABS75_33225 [Pelagibacterium sp. SCN 63-23]